MEIGTNLLFFQTNRITMPRERIEFFRDSNVKEKEKVFVLAFEGNITEEEYFE